MSRCWRVVEVEAGWCGLAGSRLGLARCTLPHVDRTAAVEAVSPGAVEKPQDDLLAEAAGLLEAYFSGQRVSFDLPLAPEGLTEFGERVLEACAAIDYGATLTYGDLGAGIGSPGAARAVGQALGRNPLLVVVPCHRVIGVDGSAVGFSAGLEWKLRLLKMEGSQLHQRPGALRGHKVRAGDGE